MFGDDLDPTVTTPRVGFGTTFGRASEGVYASCKEGFRGLAVIADCADGLERKERESPATVFEDRKRPTLDWLYCRYS